MINQCKNLKLKTFIEISEDIDKLYLLIENEKKVSDEDLYNAWLDILDEFNSLIKTKNYSLSLRKRAEIEVLKQTISLYYVLIELLAFNGYEFNLKIVSICEKLKIQPDKNTLEKKVKGLELKLKLKLKDLPKGISTSFEELKEGVERFRGFYIDAEKVVVSEWASYLVAMQKQSEKNKPKGNKRNGRKF